MNITLSEQKITEAAHRIKTLFANKNITRNGKPIGANFCQQIITYGLLDKPFEEVLKLLAREEIPLANNVLDAKVFVFKFKYGSDALVAYVNELSGEPILEYLLSQAVGTDMEISESEIYHHAESMAKMKCTTVETVHLPEMLSEDWEYEEVLLLATAMQYHQRSTTLLDELSRNDIKVFIDDNHCPYLPSDQWGRDLISVSEDMREDEAFSFEAAMKEVTAWMPEFTDEDNNFYEFFFSVDDMVNATRIDGSENKWSIGHDIGNDTIEYVIVTLFKETNTPAKRATL